MDEYRPGVCNIGPDERRKRRLLGGAAFALAAGYAGVVVATGRPDALVLGTLPLLFGGFLGLLQDRLGFCAGFGVLGRYDPGAGDDPARVTDADALRRDRVRALQIAGYAFAAAVVATGFVSGVALAV